MMPFLGLSLPPELVDIVVQYISDDKRALRSCTLVSRTWSGVSQRSLFYNVWFDLFYHSEAARLLHELSSNPHLQTLICRVVVSQRKETVKRSGYNDVSLSTYMSCLASVIALLPNLKFMRFNFQDTVHRRNGAIQSYLDLIRVSGSSPLVEINLELSSTIEDFHDVFEALEGTNVKRLALCGIFEESPPVDVGASVKRLHLPSLESIRLLGGGLHVHFQDWLTRRADVPNLQQCEIVVDEYDNALLDWRAALLRGFLPLKLFKLEITDGQMDYHGHEEDVLCPLPLAGLHFQHVHLSIEQEDSRYLCQFIEWWSSIFRALSDSEATIHFTELTFTFADPANAALMAAWQSLDSSLSHPMFGTVRSIHFEKSDHTALITQRVYPALALKVRLALPRLASRGVLCLV